MVLRSGGGGVGWGFSGKMLSSVNKSRSGIDRKGKPPVSSAVQRSSSSVQTRPVVFTR